MIGIYCGEGSSHSLLWWIETLEKYGYNLHLFDENLPDADVLIIGGGDAYAIARALGERNLKKIEWFIRRGGIYIGSCAGAYLPLHSSKPFLSWFNLVEAKIANIGGEMMEHSIPYGCNFIYHPIRGPLRISYKGRIITVPLYGGPSLVPWKPLEILATYHGFTSDTKFILDRKMAEEMILGKVALLQKNLGEGKLYLLGPHFEHPDFESANSVLLDILPPPDGRRKERRKRENLEIKKELSDARVAASGIESKWKIGEKVWESEKFLWYVNAIWKRVPYLESEEIEKIKDFAREVKEGLRLLGSNHSSLQAEKVVKNLRKLSQIFFNSYFS